MAEERIFFYGDPGVNLTTTEAGNTGDGGDIPLTVVSPSNTTRIQYYNGPSNDGTRLNPWTEETVVRMDNTSGNVNEIRKNKVGAGDIRVGVQFCFRLYSLTGGTITTFGQLRSADNVSTAGEMRLSSGNALALNTNGSTVDTMATPLVADGTEYVYDAWFELGTTTSNGKCKHRLRSVNADGTFNTIHNGVLQTNRNTGIQGTDIIDSIRGGKMTSASTLGIEWIQWAYNVGGADYCSDPITGICGTDQVVEPAWTTAEQASMHAKGRGVWAQTSGPAVSIVGSGKDVTYLPPKTLDGAFIGFSYGRDTVQHEVLPVTDRLLDPVSGLWVPVRFVKVGDVF